MMSLSFEDAKISYKQLNDLLMVVFTEDKVVAKAYEVYEPGCLN